MYKEIIMNILVTIIIPAIGSILGFGINYGLKFAKIKLADTKIAFAVDWIDRLVKAAEQKWSESGMGVTKKTFVTNTVNTVLSKFKINLTESEVDALIESSVKALNDAAAK